MAITAAFVTAETYTENSVTYNRLKSGTFSGAPAAGSATVTLTYATPADTIIASDIGRYLYYPTSRFMSRITNVSGAVVTLEQPTDRNSFAAFVDSQGNNFDEDVIADGDGWTLSLNSDDLVTIDGNNSDNTINLTNGVYVKEDGQTIVLPDDTLVIDDGYTVHRGLIASQYWGATGQGGRCMFAYGRVHSNWKSSESDADNPTAPLEPYYSGGACIQEIATSGWGGTQALNQSVQWINSSYVNLTGTSSNIFLRFYGPNGNVSPKSRCIMVNSQTNGDIGGRLQGERSYVDGLVQYDNTYNAFNLRDQNSDNTSYFGAYNNVEIIDSAQGVYYWDDEAGPLTIVDGIKLTNPKTTGTGRSLLFINDAGSDKSVTMKNIDIPNIQAIEANDSGWLLQYRSSDENLTGAFYTFEQDYLLQANGADASGFAKGPVRTFIYTEASGDQTDITYTEDVVATDEGDFGSIPIKIREYRLGRQVNWSDTPSLTGNNDVEWVNDNTNNPKPAYVTLMSRGFVPVETTEGLQKPDENNFTATFLPDASTSIDTEGTAAEIAAEVALIDAYETDTNGLDTAQKAYDFQWKVLWDDAQAVAVTGQAQFFTLPGGTLTTDNDVTFQATDITGGDNPRLDYDGTNGITIVTTADFTDNIDVGDNTVTMNNLIRGGVDATGGTINFTTGLLSDGDVLIDTPEAVTGTIALAGGNTYTLRDFQASSDTIFTQTGTGEVRLIGINVIGSPDVSDANVVFVKEVTVTGQAEEIVTPGDLSISAYEYTTGGVQVGTELVSDGVTYDDELFTFSAPFSIDPDNELRFAVYLDGYKIAQTTTLTGNTITLEKYETNFMNKDAVSDNTTVQTSVDALIAGMTVSWDATNLYVDYQFANDDALTADITDAESRNFIYILCKQDEYLGRVAREFIEPDAVDFDLVGILVGTTPQVHYSKVAGGTAAIEPNSQIVDSGNTDQSSAVTNVADDEKVRFNKPATVVFNTNANLEAAADRLKEVYDDDVKVRQNDMSLGIPIS